MSDLIFFVHGIELNDWWPGLVILLIITSSSICSIRSPFDKLTITIVHIFGNKQVITQSDTRLEQV